jgi:tRNA nucleotidyltransferase (CCA-adding enzyme)
MQLYPAGEVITRRLLDLPQQQMEWVITGADADALVVAGFHRHPTDQTRFIHPESGDIYQLARRQYLDEQSGRVRYQCDRGVSLENELETRALTIVAMASDGDDIVDPLDGQDDLINGALRYATPLYEFVPQNLLITAVWAAVLNQWGFRITHGTFSRMKKMVASGSVQRLSRDDISDAVLRVMTSSRPSEFFRVLHRCGALRLISVEMSGLFDADESAAAGKGAPHEDGNDLPDSLKSLDRAAAETDNVSTLLKHWHTTLGDIADVVFSSFGLQVLFERHHDAD